MKIIIDKEAITIDDNTTSFEFVNVTVGDMQATVSVNELMAALIAFDAQNSRFKEDNKHDE